MKLWNLGVRACMDTFYGHTAPVNSMDIIQPNKPLTVGEDNTARSWKVWHLHELRMTPICRFRGTWGERKGLEERDEKDGGRVHTGRL